MAPAQQAGGPASAHVQGRGGLWEGQPQIVMQQHGGALPARQEGDGAAQGIRLFT